MIKIGEYYCNVENGEYIVVEEIGRNPRVYDSLTVRYRTTQKSGRCVCRGGSGICQGCISEYQTCWHSKGIKRYFKEISRAKGILLLGELDE